MQVTTVWRLHRELSCGQSCLPEDVDRFEGEWRAAMAIATESLELDAVQAFLRQWRLIARLTVGLGHDG